MVVLRYLRLAEMVVLAEMVGTEVRAHVQQVKRGRVAEAAVGVPWEQAEREELVGMVSA